MNLAGLSDDEVKALFSGAPVFSVEKTKGRRRPSVDFPYNGNLAVRDVSDSPQLSHEAFSAATLRPHLRTVEAQDSKATPRVGYDIDVVEVPSMLGLQAHEPGCVGFEHFLEIPYSDNLRTEERDEMEASRNREVLEETPEKLGIKWLDLRLMYERLKELGQYHQTYQESGGKVSILDHQQPGELYAHLFGKFLTPPRFDGSTGDPTGLKVQIETLMRVLRIEGIWRDFSIVEWRIRLGKLLWEPSTPEESEHDAYGFEQPYSERDMFLLQVLLASELLLRLDAISGLSMEEVTNGINLTAAEVRNFASLRTRKTDWDLVLARRFLENIEVLEETPSVPMPRKRGFFSALSVNRGEEHPANPAETEFWLRPRHQDRQLSGLLHFAEAIGWPNVEEVSSSLSSKIQSQATPTQTPTPSLYRTPLESPLPTPRSGHHAGGYFDDTLWRPQLTRNSTGRSIALQAASPPAAQAPPRRPALLRKDSSHPSSNHNNGGPPNVGGWLSRSYLTGLILPGEAMSHLLISTLLENDKRAIAALGNFANLCGGFTYGGKSWWSKGSVIGRVMAAMEEAKECMGWVGVPVVPEGCEAIWVDVASTVPMPTKARARIEAGERISRDSSFTAGGGGKTEAEARGADFIIPRDDETIRRPGVRFSRFDLHQSDRPFFPRADSDTEEESDAGAGPSYTGALTFEVEEQLEDGNTIGIVETTLHLTHDVFFVAAHPCTPPPATAAALKLAPPPRLSKDSRRSSTAGTGPTHSNSNSNNGSGTTQNGAAPSPSPSRVSSRRAPAHPLHAGARYRTVAAAALAAGAAGIGIGIGAGESASLLTADDDGDVDGDEDEETGGALLVVDARGGADQEVLARAWCAQRGEHAVVARVGRACLACAVREARALGVRVVVRVG
ncbi:uncharacterized protein K452DRAFT_238319 [Aplosporella prunicola CBS 121167]|uniref:Uncharacterized protein n=1 Tax=Aplosporella prunicola CBS 121167 TaxID=1176127 RepID=A0A6A6AVA8_9PEZI|nr:uncharacterized protein K452DRAFT_238319 [Aplosporella prunicola CBS 121167]KAF2135972.1 hypothetical protein K452DRAFT_238319 [Aplosporella prunicola CBS 121167]